MQLQIFKKLRVLLVFLILVVVRVVDAAVRIGAGTPETKYPDAIGAEPQTLRLNPKP